MAAQAYGGLPGWVFRAKGAISKKHEIFRKARISQKLAFHREERFPSVSPPFGRICGLDRVAHHLEDFFARQQHSNLVRK
jgi:hypothetical protein